MDFSYSVAIRTLGTAGEKYKILLDSIQRQTIKPEKIVVVLPEGYKIPDYQLGIEEFVFSKKGMITQRLEALKYIESEYTLFCDDDLEFGNNYIEKLAGEICNSEYQCAAGPLLDLFPPRTFKYIFASLLGGACLMLKDRSKYYVKILNTGGWSYNYIKTTNHKVYSTESLPWANFLIKTEDARRIQFADESWIERNGYASFEDRVFFYKMLKNNIKTCVVSDAHYIHNDGKTSTRDLKLEPIYAGAFNHYVFWHRFIYSLKKSWISKAWCKICISYYIFMSKLYNKLSTKKSSHVYETVCRAFKEAKQFVKSDEYKSLPGVIIGD